MKIKSSTLAIILGAIFSGLAAVLLIQHYLNEQLSRQNITHKVEETVNVVVASRDLVKGDILNDQTMALRKLPVIYLHRNILDVNATDQYIGKKLNQDVAGGTAILTSFIKKDTKPENLSALLGPGERAISFPVEMLTSVARMLQAGDYVDLMVTLNDEKQQTRLLLSGVKVLASGRASQAETNFNAAQMQTISLAVNSADAMRITHAQKIGQISVVLRSEKDHSLAAEQQTPVSMDNLFNKEMPKRTSRKKVEFIIGG